MARQWVYPLRLDGPFRRLKRYVGIFLQLILFVTPWILVDGRPLLWLDLAGRRLFVAGAMFTAGDTIFLVLIGLFLAFSLFFFTALFGRMWCGYACPQTIFLEEWVRPLEEFWEGRRSDRLNRDKKALSFDKAWRKGGKWASFLLLSFVVAMSFMSYFVPAREIWTGAGSVGEYGVVGFFTFLMFWDFAWFREQFCNYLCPYARFQGALADEESQVVSFDNQRKSECIECKKCVVVCPQGIDIRDGFQLECISCGLCIDACDSVMEKRGMPTLVRYTTIATDAGKKARIARPRTFVYGGLLATIAISFVVLLGSRHVIQANIGRAPGSLFTVDADGYVRNTYLLRVTNRAMDSETSTFTVSTDGLPADAQVITNPFDVKASETAVVPVIIRLPGGTAVGRTLAFDVIVSSPDDRVLLDATFKSDSPEG